MGNKQEAFKIFMMQTLFCGVVGPVLGYRRLTARKRVLPNLFIIGAPKCGTSSFSDYLLGQGGCLPAFTKEIQFLQELPGFRTNLESHPLLGRIWGRYAGDPSSYRKFFPLSREVEEAARATGGPVYVCDNTPFYLYCPIAMERIRALCPDAKLIVMLRNPVDRAYSDYKMHRQHDPSENRSFERAMEEEISGSMPEFRRAYLYQSLYEPHLRRWLGRWDRSRIHVMLCEPLFKDARPSLEAAMDFLSLPRNQSDFPLSNRGGYSDSMPAGVRERLEAYFRPHNRKLSELLGMDLGWD